MLAGLSGHRIHVNLTLWPCLNNVCAAVVRRSDSVSPPHDCPMCILTIHSLRFHHQDSFPLSLSLSLCAVFMSWTWTRVHHPVRLAHLSLLFDLCLSVSAQLESSSEQTWPSGSLWRLSSFNQDGASKQRTACCLLLSPEDESRNIAKMSTVTSLGEDGSASLEPAFLDLSWR